MKRASTVVAAARLTVHVPVPVQPPPDHPAKIDPVLAAAVSVTDVPLGNDSAQSRPQSIPAGFEVTAPEPLPLRLTVSANVIRSNRAVMAVSAARVTVHALVPEHPPPVQPANDDPLIGAAVNVTVVPVG